MDETQLVAEWDPAIRALARQHAGVIAAEDLAQIGRLALVRVARGFRPYAYKRVRGAMLDAIGGREGREGRIERAAVRV